MLGLAQLLAVGLALAASLVIGLTAWRLRHPPRRTYAVAVARGRPGEPSELDVPPGGRSFETYTLKLDARAPSHDSPVWDIAGDDPDGPVVVATPGWGSARQDVLVRLGVRGADRDGTGMGEGAMVGGLAANASRVLVWDPPGHGEAAGACMLGTREPAMIRALAQHAVAAHGRDVVLVGWSLGGGASIVAAATCDEPLRSRMRGVIAEAPYRLPRTPARNVLRLSGLPHSWNVAPAFWMLGLRLGVGVRWRGFDRAEHAARLTSPLLVLHGDADAVCPLIDAEAIVERARAAGVAAQLAVIAGGSHNGLWTDERWARQCRRVVAGWMGGASDGATKRRSDEGLDGSS